MPIYDVADLENKDPDDVVDYSIDWSEWLDGDTIIASSWIVEAGITPDSEAFTTTITTVWLSGGTTGEVYECTNRITTAAGRQRDQTISVRVAKN